MTKGFFVHVFVMATLVSAAGQGVSVSAERDAYAAAVHRKEARSKAKALELFLKNYPNGELREAAAESLVEVYPQIGSAKEFDALEELLHINPNNLYGLTVKASLRCDEEPRPGMCADQETELVNRGLRVLAIASKPEYMTEAEFAIRKAQAALILHSRAGAEALRHSDYKSAQHHLEAALQVDPASFACVYPLAFAYLKAGPPDPVHGLFFLARAANLAELPSYQKQIAQYGKTEYVNFHGSEQGWTELMKIAKTSPTLPTGLTITSPH
jgi:tetratricopeptide (TPR) repeat protein